MTTVAPPRRGHPTSHKRDRRFYASTLSYRSRIEEPSQRIATEIRKTQSPTKREAVLIFRHFWKNRAKRKASLELDRLGATVLPRGDVRSKLPASRSVVREVFTGRVDNICDGIAFVTLFSESQEQLIAQ